MDVCLFACDPSDLLLLFRWSVLSLEQYQQHQEQLALMQKEQLEQIQQQLQASDSPSAANTQVSTLR